MHVYNRLYVIGTYLLLISFEGINPADLWVLYGGYYKYYIHNDTPWSESQNDFCSFRRV